MPTQKQLDTAFPTIIRYGGFGLTVALVVASIAGVPATQLAGGFMAAGAMILYKSVRDAANGHSKE